MAIDRTGGGRRRTPLGAAAQRRTAKDGFLASRGMPEAKPPGRGRKLAAAVAVQAPEAKPYPVQIGPSKDETEVAGPNRAGRRYTAPPRRPPPQRGRRPPAPTPPRAHPGPPHRRRTDHDRPPRPRPPPATRPIEAPGLDRPMREGQHARACPSRPRAPPHRTGASAAAVLSPPAPAALTRRRQPKPGRLVAGRGAPTPARWRRHERREATERT